MVSYSYRNVLQVISENKYRHYKIILEFWQIYVSLHWYHNVPCGTRQVTSQHMRVLSFFFMCIKLWIFISTDMDLKAKVELDYWNNGLHLGLVCYWVFRSVRYVSWTIVSVSSRTEAHDSVINCIFWDL